MPLIQQLSDGRYEIHVELESGSEIYLYALDVAEGVEKLYQLLRRYYGVDEGEGEE